MDKPKQEQQRKTGNRKPTRKKPQMVIEPGAVVPEEPKVNVVIEVENQEPTEIQVSEKVQDLVTKNNENPGFLLADYIAKIETLQETLSSKELLIAGMTEDCERMGSTINSLQSEIIELKAVNSRSVLTVESKETLIKRQSDTITNLTNELNKLPKFIKYLYAVVY